MTTAIQTPDTTRVEREFAQALEEIRRVPVTEAALAERSIRHPEIEIPNALHLTRGACVRAQAALNEMLALESEAEAAADRVKRVPIPDADQLLRHRTAYEQRAVTVAEQRSILATNLEQAKAAKAAATKAHRDAMKRLGFRTEADVAAMHAKAAAMLADLAKMQDTLGQVERERLKAQYASDALVQITARADQVDAEGAGIDDEIRSQIAAIDEQIKAAGDKQAEVNALIGSAYLLTSTRSRMEREYRSATVPAPSR